MSYDLEPLRGSSPHKLGEGRGAPAVAASFVEVAWLRASELAQAIGALEQLADQLDGDRTAPRLLGLAARLEGLLWGGGGDERIAAGKDTLLDLAADLLGEAAGLHARGGHAAAFAAEGIEGRLLEALLGAGSVRGQRAPRLQRPGRGSAAP